MRDDDDSSGSGYVPGFGPQGLAPTWSNLEQLYVDTYGEPPSPQSLQVFATVLAQGVGAGPGMFPPGFPQV